MRPVRAVALGYQGFGNVGDEAILCGIEQAIAGGPIRVEAIIAGDRAPVPAFPTARRVTSRRLLPTPAASRELRRADLLIVSGGGLLHDHWPIVIPRYLAWTLLARTLGTRVCWVGVGVGPMRRAWARGLAGLALRLARRVTVRDEASRQWVQRVSPHTRVEVVPDPAFFLPAATHTGGGGTALIVRPPVPGDAGHSRRLADALAGVAAQRMAAGRRLRVLTMEAGFDDEFATAVTSRIERATGTHVEARALPTDPAASLAELGTHDEVISLRLHGLILSALADTPCLPIVYDEKVAAAARTLGLSDLAVPLGEVTGDLLAERLDRARQPAIRASVRAAVAAQRAGRSGVAALIVEAADG